MTHPFRENLEIYDNSATSWIRCVRCSHRLCEATKEWKEACRVKLPPTKAGPLMSELTGQFLLEQLYCPSCGVLLDTDLVPTG